MLMAGGMAGIFSWIFTYPQDDNVGELRLESGARRRLESAARLLTEEQ